ncbi:MAG TPA: ribosome biogenesis GTPase Der [Terriglobales bacterium]|nr:ribosome biogenesis GTPase Der [Terriglobales bacterium]
MPPSTTKAASLPTIAIVGRPNVGKSTLFNRIIGKRRAIVGDEPGITRDRLYGEFDWERRTLRVVDTGGIIPDDPELIPAEIFRQARVALEEADAVIMVVDGRSELAAPDLELARMLLRSGKPLFLAVNKIDAPGVEALAHEFHKLGIRNLFPISAEHSSGVAELLDAVLEVLPEKPVAEDTEETEGESPYAEGSEIGAGDGENRNAEATDEAEASEIENAELNLERQASELARRETKVAIIGRPNVGKSTLLNALTNTDRAIVSPIAGTTRDAVDELVERADGAKFRFIDTAGIRRKGKTHLMAEKLSVIMARKHLEAADIALIVIDATEGVTALDANIAGYAHESGRSVVIVINKWDMVGPARKDGKRPADRNLFEQQARRALKFLNYAPMLFISASTGRNVDKIWADLDVVASERRKRVTTGEMNRFLAQIDFERASVPYNRRVKIYYMTQTNVAPPTFVLFTDKAVKLHFSYQRFLENQIRAAFGFIGTPIWIKNRPKQRDR